MNNSNFLNFINETNKFLVNAHTVEAIILESFKIYVNKQSKDFFVENLNAKYDAIAPEGFDNFIGPTAIEIKIYRDSRFVKSRMKKIIQNLFSKENDVYLKNILLVFTIKLDKELIRELKEEYNYLPINIYIWGSEEISKILNEVASSHPEKIKEILDNPSKIYFDQLFKQELESQEDKVLSAKKLHLSQLKEQYKSDDLVLFLGAGISIDAKIPTWNNLISNLMVSMINSKLREEKKEFSDVEKNILIQSIQKSNASSPLQLVRFIRSGLGQLFQKELKRILYKECSYKSVLLDSITNLCIPLRSGVGVQGIVTYNFDDVLEHNFKKKKVIKFRPIFKENDLPTREEIGIYHVHGFLPKYQTEKNNSNLNENLLVFSEEEYHQLMLNPYHWANLVQLNYFRERSCLFVGVSMTDPNVRRLLEIAKEKQLVQDDCKHYIILKKDVFKLNENEVDQVEEYSKRFELLYQQLKEAELSEIGLNVIWVDEFEEIPGILDELRS